MCVQAWAETMRIVFRNLGGSEFPPKFFEIWAAGQERKGHTFEKLACFVSRGGSMDPDAVPPDVASFSAGMTLTIGCKECAGA